MDKKYKHRVSFRLEKRKSNEDVQKEVPILADITFSGKRIWYNTGYRISASKWDETSQKVRRNNFNNDGVSSSDINQRLSKIETAVDTVFEQLEYRGEDVTPISVREELKKVLNESKTSKLTVADAYQILINDRENELKTSPQTSSWTKGTLTKHKTMLRHLMDFKSNLYFEDLSDDMLAKFELFLIGKGLSNGYTYKSMTDIKTFLNWASKKGYNKNMAYQSFKARFKDDVGNDSTINQFALSEAEMEAILAFPTNRDAIKRARDVLIFSCYTGMRFNEVMALRWSNIMGDMVDMVAKKTGKRQRFPLPDEAIRIIEKYPKDPSEADPHVFPTISNQKYNQHLKDVGRLAGITGDWVVEKKVGREVIREVKPKYELLASHAARRTFVTICMKKGISPEVIKAVTGHSTSKMMMKYVKFDDESKREKMSALNSEVKNRAETVFDHGITDGERIRLGLPQEETYFEMFEGETDAALAHLAMLCHIRGDESRRANYMKRLSTERFNEVLKMIMSGM